jgi:flagellar biosynthesis/type III secretory pathway protein FliH
MRRLTWDRGFDAPSDTPAAGEDAAGGRLRQAWADGHAAGIEAGRAEALAEAAASDAARCAEALDRLLAAIRQGAAGLDAMRGEVATAGARMVVQALQALLPALAPRAAAIQAESLVEAAILAAAGKPTLAVAAAPDLHPDLARHFADRAGPDGPAVTVAADDSLAPGAVAARWDGGSAEWSAAAAAERIGAVLDRMLEDL